MTKKNNFNSGDINSQNIDRTKEVTLSNQEEIDNDFIKFFAVLKRRWLVFLVMTLGVTSGVGYWTYQLSPIYQGKFLLLIEKPQDQNNANANNNTNNNINLDDTLSPTSPGTFDYNTEVEILGSPSVLVPILEDVAVEYPDIFEDINLPTNENLSIKQLENTKIIEVAFKNQNPEKIKFVLDKIADSYLAKNLGNNENNINQGLKFVRNQVPQLEKKVVSLETQLQNLRQEHKFIEPQAKSTELTQQLSSIEQEYLSAQINLKQANVSYKNLEKQLNLTLEQAIAVNDLNQSQQYQSLSKELQDLEIEIATKSAVFTDISPQMITLNEKKENLVKLLEEERKKVLSQHSGKINNQQSINLSSPNEIRTKLTEQMLLKGNEIKMLESKIENLKIALDEVNYRISKMPTITRKYTDLQRELQANAESLKRFLQTREKLELEHAQNVVNWRVISPPSVKEEPVYPVPLNNLIMGLLGGLIAGTITASLIDLLDGKIYSLSQLKEATIYPILGQIPKHKNSVKNVIGKVLPSFNTESSVGWMSKTSQAQEYTSSDWIESFRNFFTNIGLLNFNSTVNSFVISSPNSMEGKSTISLNLAQTAAAMGQKVLLIDADLRLPQLHRLLGIENNQGLSEVLSSDLELESVIQQVASSENLSIITAGQVSSDPTKLLYSQKMQEIVKHLKNGQTFDLIIYDSPSLLGVVDAKIIAPNTNGLILVMRLGRSDRNSLRQVTDQLKISRVPLLGIVANGINN